MSSFPGSPKLLKGGIVLIDPATAQVQRIIALQYNPESLSRTLQVQGAGEGGDRSEALRLKGPAVETIKLEAEIDATDEMEQGEAVVGEAGISPQLAALETLLYPSSGQLTTNHTLSSLGTLEILPMETALPLFVFGQNRVIPVRVTEFSVTEEAFESDSSEGQPRHEGAVHRRRGLYAQGGQFVHELSPAEGRPAREGPGR